MVYDLGAGTFDASVVRRTAAGFEVLASDGQDQLGGLDLDAAVVGYLGAVYSGRDPDTWRRPAAGFLAWLAFSPDGGVLALATASYTYRYDVRTGAQVGTAVSANSQGGAVAVNPVSGTVVTGRGYQLVAWTTDGQGVDGEPFTGHTGRINQIAFSADGRYLASASEDGTVRVWDAATHQQVGAPITARVGQMVAVAFSPDGGTLATVDWNVNGIRRWSVSTRAQLGLPMACPQCRDLAYDPAGGLLAAGSLDHFVRVWAV